MISNYILIQSKKVFIQQNIFSLYHIFSQYQMIILFNQDKFVFNLEKIYYIYI